MIDLENTDRKLGHTKLIQMNSASRGMKWMNGILLCLLPHVP
jgi:hypothetical protein